ncbi:MAG: cupin domain-containing protein [Rhodospirillaceae bacterium]|nr:cupin domain-containing protein [Rhodospirillaceae bacterium]
MGLGNGFGIGFGTRLIFAFVVTASLMLACQTPGAAAQEIEMRVLVEHALAADADLKIKITRFHVPPGWQGDAHVHETDAVIYVLEGNLISDVEGRGEREYGPGDTYYETLGSKTVARNASQSEGLSGLIINIDRAGASGHHGSDDDQHGSNGGHHDSGDDDDHHD